MNIRPNIIRIYVVLLLLLLLLLFWSTRFLFFNFFDFSFLHHTRVSALHMHHSINGLSAAANMRAAVFYCYALFRTHFLCLCCSLSLSLSCCCCCSVDSLRTSSPYNDDVSKILFSVLHVQLFAIRLNKYTLLTDVPNVLRTAHFLLSF